MSSESEADRKRREARRRADVDAIETYARELRRRADALAEDPPAYGNRLAASLLSSAVANAEEAIEILRRSRSP